METIGWLGSILFAICGLPQAIQCAKDGHARGLNWFFLLAWFGGEILTIAYVWPKADWPLLFNYLTNLVFLLIMLRYKVKERKCKLFALFGNQRDILVFHIGIIWRSVTGGFLSGILKLVLSRILGRMFGISIRKLG